MVIIDIIVNLYSKRSSLTWLTTSCFEKTSYVFFDDNMARNSECKPRILCTMSTMMKRTSRIDKDNEVGMVVNMIGMIEILAEFRGRVRAQFPEVRWVGHIL